MFRSILCGLGLMALVVSCGNKNKADETMTEVKEHAQSAMNPCGDPCGADACGADACGADACGADACGGNTCGGNPCDDWKN